MISIEVTESDMATKQLFDIVDALISVTRQDIAQRHMVSRAFQGVDTYGEAPYTWSLGARTWQQLL